MSHGLAAGLHFTFFGRAYKVWLVDAHIPVIVHGRAFPGRRRFAEVGGIHGGGNGTVYGDIVEAIVPGFTLAVSPGDVVIAEAEVGISSRRTGVFCPGSTVGLVHTVVNADVMPVGFFSF